MIRVKITALETKVSPADAAKPWKRLGIQTDKTGDKWLGCFLNQYNEKSVAKLAVGQTLDIITETSPDGKYTNFKLTTRTDYMDERLKVVEEKLGITKEQPIDDINPDDIPF